MNTATVGPESHQTTFSMATPTRDTESSSTNPAALDHDASSDTLDIVRVASDQLQNEEIALLRRLLTPRIWWDTAYISHNSASITDSYFIWYHDTAAVAQPFEASNGVLTQIRKTSAGNARNMTMSQLLNRFCQKIQLPVPLFNDLFARVGVLTTALCKGSDKTGSRNQNLPFGIQAFKLVDRNNHLRRVSERTHGQPVRMLDYNKHAYLHKDEGMLERGLVTYFIFGPEAQSDFAFMSIVNITDEPWSVIFGTYPHSDFDMIVAMSCYLYHEVLLHFRSPINHSEAAVLAREIGRHVYGECTKDEARQVDPDGGAIEASGEVEEEEAEDEASTVVPPKPKKRRSKKKKTKAKKAVEDEAEVAPTEEACDPGEGKEDAGPETSIGSPKTSSSPSSVVTTLWSPPVVFGPVFSFLSSDPKLVCQLDECRVLANARHAASVCCPRCTAYSYTRYCSRSHLFSDVRQHFRSGKCGATLIPIAIDDDDLSIPPSTLPCRPYIQETRRPFTDAFTKNILERHRQALYRSMNLDTRVDYFIFDDLDQINVPNDTIRTATPAARKQYLQGVRGTGKVSLRVALDKHDPNKKKLNEVLDRALRLGLAAGEILFEECVWMYRVLKGDLQGQGKWNSRMEEVLAIQMAFEFGWKLPVYMRG